VTLLTDGRFSGGSHGFLVGHITPEAQEGGPIALVQNGDMVTIDAVKRTIDVVIGEEDMGCVVRLGYGRLIRLHAARYITTLKM
jgi:dihydroxyacid dehydratase/phosphogluconate dehydratase